MSDCILSVDHLSMRFGGIVAVNDLSFEARRRQITALTFKMRFLTDKNRATKSPASKISVRASAPAATVA